MAANDNVTVRIVGDASQVQPAVDTAAASFDELKPILASISAQMATMSKTMTEAFAQGAAGSHALAAGMKEARVATDAEGNALTRMVMKVHEGAESVRTFQMRAKEFAELYVAMFGIEAIAHWAESMGKAAERTAQLASQTGMTTTQIQELSGAALLTGTNIETIVKAITMMDMRLNTSAGHASVTSNALKSMGISANDGTSSLDRLFKIADKFHAMKDSGEKAALAMALFGRSGKEMTYFLDQGSAALKDLIAKSAEYGATNDKAEESGKKLADSVNLSKVAWEGLKQTLTQAFGPLLTEMVDGFNQLVKAMNASYESGGAVKVIFDAVSEVVQGLGQIVSAVALAWDTQFNTMKAQGVDWGTVIKTVIDGVVVAFKTVIAMAIFVEDAFVSAFHMMKGAAEAFLMGFTAATGDIRIIGTGLGEFMKVVGKVCFDALHLDWGDIKSDWDNGMEQVRQAVDTKAQQIVGEVDGMKNKVKADFADMMNTGKSFSTFFDQLMGPGSAPKHDKTLFDLSKKPGADAPDITNPGKGKKGKKGKAGKDDIVSEWKQQLSDMLLDEQNWGADEAQLSLKFWESKLALTKKGSKDELQVRREISQQKLALFKEEEARDVSSIKQREALQLEASKTEIELDKLTLQSKLQTIGEEEKRGEIGAAKAIELRNQVNRQLYALDQRSENAQFQVHLKALNDQLALEHLKPAVREQINRQIELLEKQHLDRMAILNQQYDAKVKADSDRLRDQQIANIRKVTDAYTQDISKMLTLQTSFMSGMKSLWADLQQTIAGILDRILQKFVLNEATKLGLAKTDATSTVATEVGKAGAGGVASMAAAPFPLNLTAPAFGAEMAAAAASFGVVAGFDIGAWNLSKDQLAVVHQGEMIIPSALAGGMRGLFQAVSNDNGGVGGGLGNGGDKIELHLHGDIIHNPAQLRQWFEANSQAVGAGVRHYVRQGGNTSAARR